MADFWIKRNDTAPTIGTTLLDFEGNEVDIAQASVTFILRGIRDALPTIEAAASNDQNGDGTDGSLGDVSYTWVEGDTLMAGGYYAEWEVTYAGGEVETFPNDGYMTVAVPEDLNGGGS